jgi:hypothetical protein
MTQDEAKKRILARRARFVAIAVASAGIAQGCGGNVDPDDPPTKDGGSEASTDASLEACLSPPWDAGDEEPQGCLQPPYDASDEEPQPCLDPIYDAAPEACLSPPYDASDEEPQPCLDPIFDAAPEVCLSPPPADAAEE